MKLIAAILAAALADAFHALTDVLERQKQRAIMAALPRKDRRSR